MANPIRTATGVKNGPKGKVVRFKADNVVDAAKLFQCMSKPQARLVRKQLAFIGLLALAATPRLPVVANAVKQVRRPQAVRQVA